MSRLFIRVLVSTVLFAVLLVVVRGIGAQSKNPLADLFTEIILADGQMQVCWHSICPGLTSVREAADILAADPSISLDVRWTTDTLLCWSVIQGYDSDRVCLDIRDDQIDQMHIFPWTTIPIGELVALWGTPAKSSIGPLCDESFILFSNNILAYTGDMPSQEQPDTTFVFQLGVQSELGSLTIAATGVQINISHLAYGAPLTTWRGFASFQAPYTGCGH